MRALRNINGWHSVDISMDSVEVGKQNTQISGGDGHGSRKLTPILGLGFVIKHVILASSRSSKEMSVNSNHFLESHVCQAA